MEWLFLDFCEGVKVRIKFLVFNLNDGNLFDVFMIDCIYCLYKVLVFNLLGFLKLCIVFLFLKIFF